MYKNFFDYFDELWCINLEEAVERWELSKQTFQLLGIKDRVKKFRAIKHDIPIIGGNQSHLNIIKDAKKRNLKNVFIFEDDCKVITRPNINEQLKNTLKFLNNNHWDMLYIGGTPLRGSLKKTEFESIFKIKPWFFGLWAYAVNNSIFSVIIELMEEKQRQFKEEIKNNLFVVKDEVFMDAIIPECIQPYYSCYFSYPIFINQRDGYSYHLGKTQKKLERNILKHHKRNANFG